MHMKQTTTHSGMHGDPAHLEGQRGPVRSSEGKSSSIMVVDDQPANLKLLEDMLQQLGYVVRSFPRGRLALAAATQCPPDLLLLDINMPEMDGFEVCREFKSRPEVHGVPVIFLSALNDIEDKVKAFHSGGLDYITKPFQLEEVQARVETHLQLQELRRALRRHADELEEMVRVRTRELADAHARLKILDLAKSDFLNLISHEFRTPLNGILGVGELLLDELDSGPAAGELGDMFEQSRRRILSILEDALLLTQIEVEAERFVSQPVLAQAVVSAAIAQASELAQSCGVELELAPFELPAGAPPDFDLILGGKDLMVKALRTLSEAVVRLSAPGQKVRVECSFDSRNIQILIRNSIVTIAPSALARFFEIFSIGEVDTLGGNLGLGPAVAYRILSLFGGSVTIENRTPAGIEIAVSLRRAESVTAAPALAS